MILSSDYISSVSRLSQPLLTVSASVSRLYHLFFLFPVSPSLSRPLQHLFFTGTFLFSPETQTFDIPKESFLHPASLTLASFPPLPSQVSEKENFIPDASPSTLTPESGFHLQNLLQVPLQKSRMFSYCPAQCPFSTAPLL